VHVLIAVSSAQRLHLHLPEVMREAGLGAAPGWAELPRKLLSGVTALELSGDGKIMRPTAARECRCLLLLMDVARAGLLSPRRAIAGQNGGVKPRSGIVRSDNAGCRARFSVLSLIVELPSRPPLYSGDVSSPLILARTCQGRAETALPTTRYAALGNIPCEIG
jgi:hypothetical protein